jgi:hypothetical protein
MQKYAKNGFRFLGGSRFFCVSMLTDGVPNRRAPVFGQGKAGR